MVDKVEKVPKMDPKEMQRIARETFPSEFMSRSTLNFEDHWELNLRIAYDDDFLNEFGSESNAEARYTKLVICTSHEPTYIFFLYYILNIF